MAPRSSNTLTSAAFSVGNGFFKKDRKPMVEEAPLMLYESYMELVSFSLIGRFLCIPSSRLGDHEVVHRVVPLAQSNHPGT
jgi:hypothetical protein